MSFEFVTLNLLGKWFDPNLYTNLLSTKKRLLFKIKTTLALDLKNESIRFSKKVVAKREVSHFSLFAPVVNKSQAGLCRYAR